MKKPVLVIMAAGMGSRYGGLKQMDPVDEKGNLIIDFSIYDAVRAGFDKVVFIITHAIEEEFKERIGNRVGQHIKVEYVYQQLDHLPEGIHVPEGRVKPWGTGHAVASCLGVVDGPFAVINADDFYGRQAFAMICDFLKHAEDDGVYQYAMVGYELENTLTENGSVARGICEIDENGMLSGICERTRIEKRGDGAAFTEDGGQTWTALPKDCTVSMNMWGFTESLLGELNSRFRHFLDTEAVENPLKCEYFLPFVVNELLQEKKAVVTVKKTADKWYGVTYKEDKQVVMDAVRAMKSSGVYPDVLDLEKAMV